MKRKMIMLTQPKKTEEYGEVFTAQMAGEILIMDHWKDKVLRDRYCINTKTGEYENLDAAGRWKKIRFCHVAGQESWQGYDWAGRDMRDKLYIAEEDEEIIKQNIASKWERDAINRIIEKEKEYIDEKRDTREFNRMERLKRLMDSVPALPEDFRKWIADLIAPGLEYAFYDKETKAYSCTACGQSVEESRWKGKIRHKDTVICPECGHPVIALRRNAKTEIITTAMLLQNIDHEKSVARHFDIRILWERGGKKVLCSEAVRIFLHRQKRYSISIYYAYTCKSQWIENSAFDRSNPCNRRIGESYLYPGDIEKALCGTKYAAWVRDFKALAETGKKLDYNALMVGGLGTPRLPNMLEYLIKGRFNRLVYETSVTCWNGITGYEGSGTAETLRLRNTKRLVR